MAELKPKLSPFNVGGHVEVCYDSWGYCGQVSRVTGKGTMANYTVIPYTVWGNNIDVIIGKERFPQPFRMKRIKRAIIRLH